MRNPDDDVPAIGRRRLTAWHTAAGRRLADRHRRLTRRIGPRPAFAVSLVVSGALAVGAAWFSAVVADQVAGRDGITRFDRPALERAKRLRSPAVDGLAAGIARGFGPEIMPFWALGAAVAVSTPRHRFAPIGLVAWSAAGAVTMTVAGKDIVRRHRPPRRDAIPPFETSPSFPSGHTLNATAVLGTIAYLLAVRQRGRAAQAVTLTTAGATGVAVGLSRVLLGAHRLTDVAVGWATGGGWLTAVITAHRLHLTRREDERRAR
jgi:undecaprenyl-diphosphatase